MATIQDLINAVNDLQTSVYGLTQEVNFKKSQLI